MCARWLAVLLLSWTEVWAVGVTSTVIERATSKTGTFTVIDQIPPHGGPDGRYVDGQATKGQWWCYRVSHRWPEGRTATTPVVCAKGR